MRNLLVAGVVALAALVASPAPAGAAEPGVEAQLVDSINALRASLGLRPVASDPQLTSVARAWSDVMAQQGLAHNPAMPRQVAPPWARVGENVGYGESVSSVMAAFVHSPIHYAVLSDPYFDSVGVGVTTMADGRFYVTEDFRAATDPTHPAAGAVQAGTVGGAARTDAVAVPASAPGPQPLAPPARPSPRVRAMLTALAPLDGDGAGPAA